MSVAHYQRKVSIISRKKWGGRIFALLFWIGLWALASRIVNQEILISSPLAVAKELCVIVFEPEFWRVVLFSCARIALGFLLAVTLGSLFAILCYRFVLLEMLISPLVHVIASTPVASIVIVILIWISSRYLSVVISFMMASPIIYGNLLEGMRQTDKGLLEMAKVFRLSNGQRLRAIYLPSILPYFVSAVTVSLGLCWKSGIAAEVIGIPTGSIGERLYQAKIFLDTPAVFAWTFVIILLSFLFERAFAFLVKKGVETWMA